MVGQRWTKTRFYLWLCLVFSLAIACRQGAEKNTATTAPASTATAAATATLSPSPTIVAPTATASATPPATTAPPTNTPSPTPALPLIMNRGAPANERCTAMNLQGETRLVGVYAQADGQATLVAYLGNWADVQQIAHDWYEILIPQGGTGWVRGESVTPTVGCAPLLPVPVRIAHESGPFSMTLSGTLSGEQQAEYLIAAATGQTLAITVSSPEDAVLFHLAGVDDGQVYKHLLDGQSRWQGKLPVTQDYLLTLDQVGDTASFTLNIVLEGESG